MKIEILGLIILIFVIAGICFYFIPIPDITTDSVSANKPVPLANGYTLEQTINFANLSTMKEIQVKFGTYHRNNVGTLKVALYEEDTEVIHWELPTENLIDNKFQSFRLEKALHFNKSAKYILKISEIYKGENTIAVWSNNSVGKFKVNDKIRTGTICYKIIGRD